MRPRETRALVGLRRRARHRRAPRPLASGVGGFIEGIAPATALGRVQSAWDDVVGLLVAHETTPSTLREGVLTVTCTGAVWAQELELMADDVLRRLEAAVGAGVVRRVRFRAV